MFKRRFPFYQAHGSRHDSQLDVGGMQIEPPLQPLNGETLHSATSMKEDGARLDITEMDSGDEDMNGQFLMLEYSIHMPHLTINRAYLRHT